MVSADHVQPSPDRPRRRGDVCAPLPRSVQLQFRSARTHRDRHRRRRDGQPHGGGGEARSDEPERIELLHVVERRPAHDGVLPQHDRPADGNDRQPDACQHSVRAVKTPGGLELVLPDRAATDLALPPVDRLFGDRELCGLRRGFEEQRHFPLQHLPDGEELNRAGEPR